MGLYRLHFRIGYIVSLRSAGFCMCTHGSAATRSQTDCVCYAFEALVLPTVAATHHIHELFVFVSISLYRMLNRQTSLRIRFNCTVALIRSSFIHENTKRFVSS